MTDMMVYTIDDPYTTETDDGISVEEKVLVLVFFFHGFLGFHIN